MPGEARRQRLRALLRRAGAGKAEPATFDAAFVHTSAIGEGLAERSNETLEFLGDAVLGFIVARSLFERYAAASEGELALRKSALVADTALAATAERLGFEALLVLGAGLANMPSARRHSALADAFEAFVAVLYRECGLEIAAAFISREHVVEHERLGLALDDPKTVLQEWSQRHYATMPAYVDHHDGPDHARTFYAEVRVAEDVRATGSGPSKKSAQRAAAAGALEALRERYDDVAQRVLSASEPQERRRGVQTRRRKTSKKNHP